MTLLCKIERYLRATDMPATRFGRLAVNDPRLVRDLRNGRDAGRSICARVDAFINRPF